MTPELEENLMPFTESLRLALHKDRLRIQYGRGRIHIYKRGILRDRFVGTAFMYDNGNMELWIVVGTKGDIKNLIEESLRLGRVVLINEYTPVKTR